MTETSSTSNKRIARNTMMLYIRTLLTMVVTLYTSRVVLNTLGVDDFGIYDVVGGFVMMFAFLNNAMASATQRFLSFEIGRKNFAQLRNVFSMSLNIHFIIALAILLLGETVGLWFVNNHLTIPAERMVAAQWVYQFSILTMMVNIVSVPYNAIIIAHERMGVFAGVSILEVSLKLLFVFILQWLGFDKLKLYAILMFSVALIIRLIYGVYCNNTFKETKFRCFWEKPLFKTLLSYAGWNLWGPVSGVMSGQGVNVLLNIFFGPTVNAARAIAYQVGGAVRQFVGNFQMAMNPQIIKSYASGDLKYMHQLVFKGAKYSFFLLYILSLPILLETNILLKTWLKIVPEYTVIFTRLAIINVLIDSFSGTLRTAAQATGRIKLYQGVVGGVQLFNLPISYLFLKNGFLPESTFYISVFITLLALCARVIIVKSLIQIKVRNYFNTVIYKSLVVAFLSIVLPLYLYNILSESFLRFFIVSIISIIMTIVAIYLFGLDKAEKKTLLLQLKNVINRLKK